MKSHYRPSLLHQARPKLVSLLPFALLTNTNTSPTKDFIVEGNKRSEEINKEQEAPAAGRSSGSKGGSWTLSRSGGLLLTSTHPRLHL